MGRFLYLYATCLVWVCGSVWAQEPRTHEFGRMTVREFMESERLRETGAEAVVLYSLGDYAFLHDDWFMEGKEPFPVFSAGLETRIKILSPEGARYGMFEFPYEEFSWPDGIFDIEGFTHNMDDSGRIVSVPLKLSDMSDADAGAGERVRRIVFPDVRDGSVVELRCVQRSRHTRMPEWRFQRGIPVLVSELVYTTCPYLGYSPVLKGARRYDYTEKRVVKGRQRAAYEYEPDYLVLRYGMKNLPAFPQEEYAGNAVDAVVRLVFRPEFSLSPRTGARTSYTRTWRQANTELSKERDFGKYVQAVAKEYRKVREAVSGEAGGSVARQLYAYVRDNYAWNGVQAACASGRVADLVRSREGSSADLNLFLAGLLRAAGTDAVPVLLRVRGSGSVEREAPSKDAFNDVAIRVTDEEGVHFLDASERFAGFGELPARCADMEGLVAEPDTEEWVMLSQEQVAFDGREVGIVVDTAGIADVSVVRTFDGAAAMNLRGGCGGSADALARMVAGEEGASAARTEACDEPGKPLVVRYVCTEEVEREEDGTLRLAPFGAVFPGDNPFGQTTVRHFPVDIVFRPVDVYRVRIAIPQGYRVKSLPSGMKVEDGISRFTYEAVAGENEVVIEAEFSLSESRYPASAYALLRKRYDGMLDALSRPVVFEPEELLP